MILKFKDLMIEKMNVETLKLEKCHCRQNHEAISKSSDSRKTLCPL